MSGVHNLGEFHLKVALKRFDNEHYDCTGCPCIQDEDGKWLIKSDTEQKVVAHNERDSFGGPGEIRLLCLDCNLKAEQREWDCDWCHHRGTDVRGFTDHGTHEECMVCNLCREIAAAEAEVDLCYDYYKFTGSAERLAEIQKAKARVAELVLKRDERKAKEKAEHTPQ